ncbi:lipoprotein [Thermosipho africanus Ob7]|uniref:hypothetical protein n=1 Tax=Thermosipho africanus TaxID=2421 RepID=UPI0006740396|nr:hypothetical protein [Thermosipho africanus]RDI91708.1 lipoprotein [Thermosipho africanus Ob7]
MGSTFPYGGGHTDVYILTLDGDEITMNEKTYGGSANDWEFSVQKTAEGGYIVAGQSNSFATGSNDAYIIKLDKYGNKEWEKAFGGYDSEQAYSIQQTTDGGYIVLGSTESFGSGYTDVYLIKLDTNGNTELEKTFGGIYRDNGVSIQQTTDGGYVIAGFTNSFGEGNEDLYIIKLDREGNL